MLTVASFLFVIGVCVILHELGHFAVAKYFGVRVHVFSFGFGPRLFGRKIGDTDYRVSLLPLGGYVQMDHAETNEAGEKNLQAFPAKPRWQRMLVLLAGPVMNLILAFVVLVVVVKTTPAASNGALPTVSQAVTAASRITVYLTGEIARTLKGMAQGSISPKELSGPVQIVRISGEAAKHGTLWKLLAVISLNLAIFNLLPIPALDGGGLLLLLIESFLGRDLSPVFKERLAMLGFLFLIGLMAFVMGQDIVKLVAN